MTRSEPDHGYVRTHQIGYAGKIRCGPCAQRYEIRDGEFSEFPWLVLRSEARLQRAAATTLAELEMEVEGSEAAAQLRARIVAEVDGQPSMAARHRVLTQFGLARESVWTYRKRPYGGEEALRWAGAALLAQIGAVSEMGKVDASQFGRWAHELEKLEERVRKLEPAPVKTGGTWLRA